MSLSSKWEFVAEVKVGDTAQLQGILSWLVDRHYRVRTQLHQWLDGDYIEILVLVQDAQAAQCGLKAAGVVA